MKGSNMYAIITTGGKQYKVAKGDVLDVEKLDVQPGDEVKLDVLMLNDGKSVLVDADKLAKKKVTCKVVDQHKGEKQLVFKFQKRKRYSRKKGHRQNLTRIEVTSMPRMTSTAKKAATTEAAE
jgi:large subunit ribosomal protein L21